VLPRREDFDAIFFDAGGTLIELDYPYIAARAAERGRSVALDVLRRAEGQARLAVDRHAQRGSAALASDGDRRPSYFGTLLDAAGLPSAERDAVVRDLEDEHARSNLWRRVAPGAHGALAALRARELRLAVISNADGRVEAMLRGMGLTEHLELVVDSHHEGVEKPDPEIFRRAAARLGVPVARACYVGDIHAIDVLGARSAGLTPVLIDAIGIYAGLDCAVVAHLDELVAAFGGAPRGASRAPAARPR
jgi:putative hydrolase of the HAD superfamily